MRPLSVLRLASAFLCLSSIYAFSQYTVKRVTFTGVTPYTDADLQAVSGLHPGVAFTSTDLQAAAQKLVDTGAFDDVQVALDGPFKTISVNFTLKPVAPDHILKASFANLIWWQPEELQSALHAKLPLFNGTLPESGNQQDAAEVALKQLLIEKGITASLTHEVIEPNLLQPRLVEFKITTPEIRLHGATITGASPALSSQIDKITASATGSLYNEGLTSHSLTERILNLYRDTGNLDASLVQLHRAPQSTTSTRIDIDLTATIQEGQPYRISSIAFAGAPLMSGEDFAKSLQLHPEDIASRKALLASLKPLDEAYRNKGYLDVAVNATPTLDKATHHVTFAISVDPGAQYHVRSINVLNLSPAQRKDFDSAWKLFPGEIFNAGYATGFLKNNTALQSLAGFSAAFKITSDPEAHLADLTITFVHGHSGQ